MLGAWSEKDISAGTTSSALSQFTVDYQFGTMSNWVFNEESIKVLTPMSIFVLFRQDLPRHVRGRHGFSGSFAFPASGP